MNLRIIMRSWILAAMLIASVSVIVLSSSAAVAQAGPSTTTSTGSPAEGEIKTVDANGSPISCKDLPEAQGGKLLGKIVPCMIKTIQESTVKFAAEMVAALKPIFYAFLTLVVVLFGVRMLSQEPEIHKQGFLLLVKIAIISIILADLGNTAAYDGSGGGGKIIPTVYGVMNESQAIVAGAINTTNVTCDIQNYQGANTPKVWAMMDCIMGKLWGFTTGTNPSTGQPTTNMLLVSSFFGLMTGFFFGGAWGVTIFLGMLGTLFTIFMMVVRTAIAFLTSYLMICLMLIISPLLLPLAFLKITTQYYEKVWRIILAAFLTPILITAYSMFSLILYDKVLFSPDAPIQKLFKYENIKDALQPARPACNKTVTNNPYELPFDTNTPSEAQLKKRFVSPFLQNNVLPTLTGGNNACATLSITPLDPDKIEGFFPASGPNASEDRKKAYRKIFNELLSLFIIAYLIYKGLDQLPTIIQQITGSRSPTTAAEGVGAGNVDFSQRGKEAYQSAVAAFEGKKPNSNNSGADFLRDLPTNSATAIGDTFRSIAPGKNRE